MPAYRLEVWFDYNAGTINWGVAQAAVPIGNPPFSNGGSAIAKTNGGVTIRGAGNSSSMDVYVFDTTGDGVARDLQWIEVDYEKGQGANPGGGRDPIAGAEGLRTGMTGAEFMGTQDGGASGTTTGVGQENTLFSAPSGTTAERRWSLDAGFEGLTPGNYQFTVAIVVTPANGGQALVIDPEMDIES